jgi:hypothetical protein
MFTQPPIIALRFRAGAVHTKRFTWKAAGVPVDLTGWTGVMEVRDAAGGLAYRLDTTPNPSAVPPEGAVTLGSGANNVTVGPLPGPLAPGEYRHGLLLTAPGGAEAGYFFVGSLVVEPGVVE